MTMNGETVQSDQSPAGWKSGTLGAFGQFKGGSGFPIRYQGRTEGFYPFIKVSDFSHPQNKDGITTANHFIDKQTLKAIGAKVHISGSIVFAKIGAALFLERKRRLFVDCCIDNNMMSYLVDEAIGNPQFFHVLFNSIKLSDAAAASALPVLSTSDLRGIEFCCPPLPEQQAIAKALGDVDGLIASLEALIAKKRDIKQGAMQELLSGYRRLPGFTGEWVQRKLGDVAPLQRGFDLPTTQIINGPHPVIYSNGAIAYHKHKQVKGPGVITGRSGTLGAVFYLEEDFWPHNTTLWVTNFKGNAQKFIYFLFNRIDLNRFASGSGVPTLNRNDVHSFVVELPRDPLEQEAIANVLSDMDTEIIALEAKLAKTRDIKQGMMQVLLTGEVRLV